MTDAMQVQVTRHYAENRGDHAADGVAAHTYDPDETVADMVRRVMGYPLSPYSGINPAEFIVLRVVSGTEPREKGPVSDLPPF